MPKTKTISPASAKQISYLLSLAGKQDGQPYAHLSQARTTLGISSSKAQRGLSMSEASAMIERLKTGAPANSAESFADRIARLDAETAARNATFTPGASRASRTKKPRRGECVGCGETEHAAGATSCWECGCGVVA